MSVVLPCLNEAGSVGLVVKQALDALAAGEMAGEVVVADNGSTDGSADLALAAGARVIDVPLRGYGAALSAGFEAAQGEICVMGDADATYPFELLGTLVEPIANGDADMALGSRLAGATGKTMPFLHRFVGTPLITWLVRRAGGPIGVADSQSGFRAFRRDRLLALRLQSTGMEYASEMLVLAGRAGWRVREIDAGYRERIGNSKLETFPDGMRHLVTILLLAPDLAAIIPGTLAVIAGVFAILWALIDPAIRDPGSAGWWASFFAPAMLVLGSQAVMVGLLLADRSPMSRHPRGASSDILPYRYLLGGIWAVSAGLILIAALAMVSVLGFQPPFRGPQIEMIALVLVLIGGGAIGTSLIARVLDEGMRRYPRSFDHESHDQVRSGDKAGEGGEPTIAGEAERSRS